MGHSKIRHGDDEVFIISPDGFRYKWLRWDDDLGVSKLFFTGEEISKWVPPEVWPEALENDIMAELELKRIGDDGDPELAKQREKNGVADCAYLSGFSGGLLISESAKLCFEEELGIETQFLNVGAGELKHTFFNCVNTLDALDDKKCEVRLLPNGRPVEILQHAFRPDVLNQEFIFKVRWPLSDVPDSIALPRTIFATAKAVAAMKSRALSSFIFTPIRTLNGRYRFSPT